MINFHLFVPICSTFGYFIFLQAFIAALTYNLDIIKSTMLYSNSNSNKEQFILYLYATLMKRCLLHIFAFFPFFPLALCLSIRFVRIDDFLPVHHMLTETMFEST